MKPILTRKKMAQPWRTHFMSEFAEGAHQTYKWHGTKIPLYDEPQNQFRMLRVLNETHNIAYIQWDQDYVFDKVDFREYYDLKGDNWQQTNLWNSTDPGTQAALHAELVGLYVCRGSQNEASTCHDAYVKPMPTPDSPTSSLVI